MAWILTSILLDFDFEIIYKKVKENKVENAFLRSVKNNINRITTKNYNLDNTNFNINNFKIKEL